MDPQVTQSPPLVVGGGAHQGDWEVYRPPTEGKLINSVSHITASNVTILSHGDYFPARNSRALGNSTPFDKNPGKWAKYVQQYLLRHISLAFPYGEQLPLKARDGQFAPSRHVYTFA